MPGCRTWEEASLLIIRIVSKHTCLSAKRGSEDPPQSVPLQASSTDPISRRVNPALAGRDFCRPSPKEVSSPPTFETLLSSSAVFNHSNRPSLTPLPCWVSLRIPCEAAAQWKRSEDKRMTGVLISLREFGMLLLVSICDTWIIYTGRSYNCTNSLEHGGIQGNVVPETDGGSFSSDYYSKLIFLQVIVCPLLFHPLEIAIVELLLLRYCVSCTSIP